MSYEELLREQLEVPEGWHYRETPLIRKDYWDQIVRYSGSDNLIVASGIALQEMDVFYVRASFFINDDGLAGLEKLKEKLDAPSSNW